MYKCDEIEQTYINQPLGDLSDTLLSQWNEDSQPLMRLVLKTKDGFSVDCKLQKENLSLQHVLKVALSVQEARDVSKCYFVCDEVLFRKWRPLTTPTDANWATYE